MKKRTIYNTSRDDMYKVIVYNGYVYENENGYVFPEEKYTWECCYYKDALSQYKKEKAENDGAVIFINKDGSVRHFKTI